MIRTLLVLVGVAVVVVVLLAMRRGWNRRGERQAPLLAGVDTRPPAALGAALLDPADGLYVGTVTADSWQDRVVAGGLGRRAAGTAALYPEGALLDRDGDEPVFIPRERLVDARVEPALANKVMGRGGLLVLRWEANGTAFDSGFRADDRRVHLDWVDALDAAVDGASPAIPATPPEEPR